MYLEDLRHKLENYQEDLPGLEAQLKLSPPYKEELDLEEIKKSNPRIAAVMIMLYENDEGNIEFPIILRQMSNDVHSNQFSLPGGGFEAEDIDLANTALRETAEEIGVDIENIEIVKQLSELYIPPSDFLVYPFIGIHYGVPSFIAEEEEVAEIIPLDLEAFLLAEPENFDKSFAEYLVEIPGYRVGDDAYIWGATAMILSEFASLLEKL